MFSKYLYFLLFLTFIVGQDDVIVNIDASNYYEWVYFSFDQAAIVEIDNPENSLEWDVAFQRKHIRTNSGLAGIGNGGAYVDSSITWVDTWDTTLQLPENIFFTVDTLLNDFYIPSTHTFGEDIKNPVLNSWGWFDEDYHMNVTHYALFVLLPNGVDVVKFWPSSYYSDQLLGGHIQLRYEAGFSYEMPCDFTLGDVNFDGSQNVIDIVQIVSYILSGGGLNPCQLNIGDINYDGVVNVIDIVNFVNLILSTPE